MPQYFCFSPSPSGYYNLALDRYFLECAEPDDIILFFYVNKNAVIIGKNQNAWKECNLKAMEKDCVELVRRHTGGGAVYHDAGNLNFSLILPSELFDLERQFSVVISALKSLGIDAVLSGRNDILVSGKKISGNAFAMGKLRSAHHGTLLVNTDLGRLSEYLNPSVKKLKSKGIDSVHSRVANLSEFIPGISPEMLKNAIVSAFGKEYGNPAAFETDGHAEEWIKKEAERISSWEWKMGNSPRFDFEIYERFSFGEVQILVSAKEGVITDTVTYTDALDTDLPSAVGSLLAGSRFSAKDMSERLSALGPAYSELISYVSSLPV